MDKLKATQKDTSNRPAFMQSVVDFLFESGWHSAGEKLRKVHESTSRTLTLVCGDDDDRMIHEALRSFGLGHAFLAKNGVTYIIK